MGDAAEWAHDELPSLMPPGTDPYVTGPCTHSEPGALVCGTRAAAGDTRCIKHGGGPRCAHSVPDAEPCATAPRPGYTLCAKHGGGKRCEHGRHPSSCGDAKCGGCEHGRRPSKCRCCQKNCKWGMACSPVGCRAKPRGAKAKAQDQEAP